MDAIVPGILLGLANTLVIALGLALGVPSRALGATIALAGFVPGMLFGAFLGGIAERTAREPAWVRVILLAPIPLAFVVLAANGLRLGLPGDLTAIPTFVAVLLLESWSRMPASGAELPRARVATNRATVHER